MAGPHIQAIQISCQLCSNVDIKDSWAHRILQRAHKISNGPLKFETLHVFEWDMGHWPILRAHHHFGLELTLGTVDSSIAGYIALNNKYTSDADFPIFLCFRLRLIFYTCAVSLEP